MKILAAGGGSGGHVSPVAAVFNELAKQDKNLEAMFVCDKAFAAQSRGLMEKVSVPVRVEVIPAGKFRKYAHLSFWQHFTVPGLMWNNFKDVFKVVGGIFKSLWIIHKFKPDVVFAKGGFVCIPVGLAARILRVPLVIHDSDARPGLTNRILSRWAKYIATGSPLENYNYPPEKSSYTGVPIGAQFKPKSTELQREAKRSLGFNPDKLLVVAVGGGLGAASINLAMVRASQRLFEQGINAYVVAGKGHYDEVIKTAPKREELKVVPFVYEKMDEVLGAADIVVSRGSATFLQELAGLGKAVIIVPAHQLGDQIKNAAVFSEAGAAIVVNNQGITGDDRLERAILNLADDPLERTRLAKKLHTFAKPKASWELAQIIVKAAKH